MSVAKRLRFEVFRRDGVVPVALGGTDDPSNLVTACKDCNAGKTSSHPDAPLVAEVAQDAMRWAQAQKAAAARMLAQLEERTAIHREFEERWNRWTGSSGRPVELPVGWQQSVDNFLEAGLPMPLVLDSIDKAMSAPKVSASNVFRYTCGIAWKRVKHLQQATTSLLAPNAAVADAPCCRHEKALYGLIGKLPQPERLAEAEYRAHLSAEYEDHHADDEDGNGAPFDFSSWEEELKAVVRAIEIRMDEEDDWGQHASYVIGALLGGDWLSYINRSRAAFRENGWSDPAWAEVVRYAVTLAVEDHTGRHGGRRPVAQTQGADPWGEG